MEDIGTSRVWNMRYRLINFLSFFLLTKIFRLVLKICLIEMELSAIDFSLFYLMI